MKATLEALKKQILASHKTPYAFCRDNPQVKRSTLYQILAGKYPGNAGRQIERIQAVLSGSAAAPAASRPQLTVLEAYEVLQQTKCAHCRRLDKRACPDCRTQTEREAQALADYLRSREEV